MKDLRLKPVLRNASEIAGWEPVFPDELSLGREPGEVVTRIRSLIAASDLTIVLLTENRSRGVFAELELARSLAKPAFVFVSNDRTVTLSSLVVSGKGVRYYSSSSDLKNRVVEILRSVKSALSDSYARASGEQGDAIRKLEEEMERNVLVLGRDADSEGMKLIARIEEVVRRNDYNPISLKKLPTIKHLTLENRMIRLASICRFVLVEESRPSGAIDELRLCAESQFVTATMKQAGKGATWMQAYYPLVYPLISRFCYHADVLAVKDKTCDSVFESLEEATNAGILWANNKIVELSRELERFSP
jgi:hypothetical protein